MYFKTTGEAYYVVMMLQDLRFTCYALPLQIARAPVDGHDELHDGRDQQCASLTVGTGSRHDWVPAEGQDQRALVSGYLKYQYDSQDRRGGAVLQPTLSRCKIRRKDVSIGQTRAKRVLIG